jgi:glycerol-3-phosphate dehydrogenase (NAD(P)+)
VPLTALPPQRISVLGAGAWGTALAIALARKHHVLLWARNPQAVDAMRKARENNAYLPGFAFPDQLQVTASLDEALAHLAPGPEAADTGAASGDALLILGCPVAGLRPLLTQLKGRALPKLVWLCKGFEEGSGLLPHQVVEQVLGKSVPGGSLSGPSFAQEVAQGLPCALTIASPDKALRAQVVATVHGGPMRVYACDDLIGVEVGGAVKNVLAIATGVADGLGLGLNARAALITRGLAEITRLGVALGGRAETFTGLAGMGDLILTCTGNLSRNRKVGLALARGQALDAIIEELGHVAEGVPCARAVRELSRKLGVDMPITHAVAGMLFDGMAPQAMLAQLLARDPRDELAD